MMRLLVRGVWETLAMTLSPVSFGFVIGLPVGVLLYVGRARGRLAENARPYRPSAVINIFRSIPFIILPLVRMIPFTRIIVGNLHWFAGRDCTADRRRRAFYRPLYGRKCVIRRSRRADFSKSSLRAMPAPRAAANCT